MFSGSKCFNRPCKPQIMDKNLMKIIFDKKNSFTCSRYSTNERRSSKIFIARPYNEKVEKQRESWK